jgi:YggT family protein
VGLEVVFTVTDPPIRLLRRALPPLDIGGRALDLSVLVLFILIWIAQALVNQLMLHS